MKRIAFILIFASLAASSCLWAFGGEDLVVESRLFVGTKVEEASKSQAMVVITSFSDPVVGRRQRLSSGRETGTDLLSSLKAELADIYQLKDIELINSGQILWDGKKDVLTQSILFDGKLYPIVLYPKTLPGKKVAFKIEINRYSDQGTPEMVQELEAEAAKPETLIFVRVKRIQSSWSPEEKVLSTELTVLLDDPVVVGFPANGHSYFLALQVKKLTGDLERPAAVKAEAKDEGGWPQGVLVPPKPRLQVIPVYPESCKKENIEGAVTLLVSNDKEGNVKRVRVVIPAHPDLDAAAVEAVRQWKFEPVFIGRTRIEAIFNMSVDFKLRDTSPPAEIPGSDGNR